MKVLAIVALLLSPILLAAATSGEYPVSRETLLYASPTPTPTPTAESWWRKLLRVAGISVNPGAQRSPPNSGPDVGEIWIKSLAQEGGSTRIAGGKNRSPIFLARDENILALRDQSIVLMPLSGGSEQLLANKHGIVKLVGIDQDDPTRVLVVMERSGTSAIGLLSLTDQSVTEISFETKSREGQSMFALISGWDRHYCNTDVYEELQCEKNAQGDCRDDRRPWTDVMVKRGYKDPIKVTNCKGSNCGQASLSLDAQSVVYIKSRGSSN